jgi:hypothetical protein
MKQLVCAAILVYGCVLAVFAQQAPAGDRFYQAIRANDIGGSAQARPPNSASNAEDASGMTPLMLAARLARGKPSAHCWTPVLM